MSAKVEILHDGRLIPANGLYPRNIHPYTGVQYDVRVDFGKGRVFRIATYQAYNAMGLIGSECNGIVLLDETNRQVVFDELANEPSGWGGLRKKVFDIVDGMAKMSWSAFRKSVNSNERLRYEI